FLQQKPIGATDVEQTAGRTVGANEFDCAGEFAPQHRLGAAIVGIAVGAATGEIVVRIVLLGLKAGRLRASQAASGALQHVASVFCEQTALLGRLAASGTEKLHRR